MTGRRTIVGLCMLCALAFSAIAAQSASAVTKGTTAFTCKEVATGTGHFKKAHCKPEDAGTGATSNWDHVAIEKDTTTELRGGNAKTNKETNGPEPTFLKETIAGVPLELESTTTVGIGTMFNRVDAVTGEHYVEGEGEIIYENVTVKAPAGKGCKVYTDTQPGKTKGAEKIVDTKVKATTKGQGDFLKFEPQAGAFATFFIECTTKVEGLEGTWEITGSIKCPTDGATVVCTHTETTTQNTLKGKGSKAGLEGKLTIEGKDPNIVGDSFRALSTTTVETP
jgi:hypothetical protein